MNPNYANDAQLNQPESNQSNQPDQSDQSDEPNQSDVSLWDKIKANYKWIILFIVLVAASYFLYKKYYLNGMMKIPSSTNSVGPIGSVSNLPVVTPNIIDGMPSMPTVTITRVRGSGVF